MKETMKVLIAGLLAAVASVCVCCDGVHERNDSEFA
jgi:hypothetical protein